MKIARLVFAAFLFWGTSVHAETVTVTSSANTGQLRVGDSFVVNVRGAGFGSSVVGGAFALSFNSAMLRLDSWTTDSTVWALGGGRSATTGDYFFNALTTYPVGSFNIGNLNFTVIGAGSTAVGLADPTLNWSTTGGQPYPNQNGIVYGSLPVSVLPTATSPTPVPMPSEASWVLAALLAVTFGSAHSRIRSRPGT